MNYNLSKHVIIINDEKKKSRIFKLSISHVSEFGIIIVKPKIKMGPSCVLYIWLNY